MVDMTRAAHSALVVGTGFGCRVQIPALRAAGFDVIGLVGEDADRTQQRAELNGVPRAFTDLDEAITQTGATVLAIATPPNTHGPLVMTAIGHGCHILCEKPFALDSLEASQMLAAAEQAGIVHLIGHEFRLVPSWATFARVVAEGLIGEPRFAAFTAFTPSLANPNADMPDWWFDKTAGGGWLGAQGSHLVDWVRCVLGDIESLSGALPTVSARGDGAEDSYVFRFRTASGVEAVLQQTTAAWGPPVDVTRIAGDKGTVWMQGGEVFVADRDGVRTIPIADDLTLPPLPPLGADPRFETPKWKMLAPFELPPYIRLCEAFRSLIDGGQPVSAVPLSTFSDGLACMQVLDAVRQSAANGGACITVPGRA
jgi:predicted dehydrogenase